jgi:hypothetical protein
VLSCEAITKLEMSLGDLKAPAIEVSDDLDATLSRPGSEESPHLDCKAEGRLPCGDEEVVVLLASRDRSLLEFPLEGRNVGDNPASESDSDCTTLLRFCRWEPSKGKPRFSARPDGAASRDGNGNREAIPGDENRLLGTDDSASDVGDCDAA